MRWWKLFDKNEVVKHLKLSRRRRHRRPTSTPAVGDQPRTRTRRYRRRRRRNRKQLSDAVDRSGTHRRRSGRSNRSVHDVITVRGSGSNSGSGLVRRIAGISADVRPIGGGGGVGRFEASPTHHRPEDLESVLWNAKRISYELFLLVSQ